MQAPGFWQVDGVVPALLSPLSAVVEALTASRVARPGTPVGIPVICCGNATVGGTGKTPLALDLAVRLQARGMPVAFLTRGHGGRAHGVVRVDPTAHDADAVGDEALLLAAVAPVFVAADRVAGARAALAERARVLIMDDGLQNPGLAKDLSILVIDAEAGFGNGRVLPAGPLREPPLAAAARCQAAVVIGPHVAPALQEFLVRLRMPVLRARLVTQPPPDGRIVAFAGIGRPEKFFAGLRAAGADLAQTRAFADHHRYSDSEFLALQDLAHGCGAALVTTAKDSVRLPAALRAQVQVAPARLQWDQPEVVERLLDTVI